MALTYDKIAAVMSQTPDSRKDFEVLNLLPWFRKKSDLFKRLKTDILFDVIKFCHFVRKPKDDILIRQGEQGNCMYILMRGKVTIYIQYGAKDGDKEEQTPAVREGENVRGQLGTFVVSLGQGATFGEVALLSDDCIRTASIITDEPTDLIVVDRELYNRSVKTVLKKEFEDKSNFVSSNPFFHNWSPRYKKQLTMALQKESLPYDTMLTRQGAPVIAMYFIISGEVKLTVDPVQHRSQYPKFFQQEGSILDVGLPHQPEEEARPTEDLIKTISGEGPASAEKARHRRLEKKKALQEVCLLGVNECIGDLEVLLDLDTYMQNVVCTQKTDVLVLEMKHWERLLVKRNPRTIEAMRDQMDLRLRSRSSRHVQKTVPLLGLLLEKAEEYLEQKQAQTEARSSGRHDRHSKSGRLPSQTFDDFIPSRGPLIDQYGPGTVFHKIRERDKIRQKKKPRSRLYRPGGLPSYAAVQMAKEQQSRAETPEDPLPHLSNYNPSAESPSSVDYQTSDPVLTNLEERMRTWLTNDGTGSRAAPRVMRLQRSQTEVNELRPGVTVRVRPKHELLVASESHQGEEEFVHHGTTWVRSSSDSQGQVAF